jgi:hypothetical protein
VEELDACDLVAPEPAVSELAAVERSEDVHDLVAVEPPANESGAEEERGCILRIVR